MKRSISWQLLSSLGLASLGIGLGHIPASLSQENRPQNPIINPGQFRINPLRIQGFSNLQLKSTQINRPIRVIARLSESAMAGSTPSLDPKPAAIDSPLAQINVAQTRLLNRLSGVGIRDSSPIENVPFVVLEASGPQLEQMIANGEIADVYEDTLSDITLDGSTPLIRAPQAWARGARGAGQSIAILDTGVQRNHPFLSPRVVEEACYSTNSAPSNATSLCPGGVTSSTAAGSAAPCTGINGCDHGTHVAGIAAGRGSGTTRFNGVAPDASIFAIQVFSRFTDTPGNRPCADANRPSPCILTFASDQIRALTRVRDRPAARNVVAVNMSLGGGRNRNACDNDPRKNGIDELINRRVATIISSGNNGFRDSVGAPGCISTAIAVGATTDADAVAGYSNISSLVDLLAPGSVINSSVSPSGFGNKDGTSMAAPHVAGAFAAIRSRVPAATVAQILNALRDTGTSINVPGTNPPLSRRRINLDRALASFLAEDGNPGTHRTGPIQLRQTFTVDFDAGRTAAGSASDLWFQAVTARDLYLTPINGATMWVGNRSNRNYAGCVNGIFTNTRVPLADVPVGSYACMKTNQGRISQFRVNSISAGSPKQIQLGFTTWNLP